MLELIKLYKIPVIIVAFFLYTLIAVFGGWKLNTYYTGYQDGLAQRVETIVNNGISTYQSNQAKGLEDTKAALDNVKTNTIVKEKTIIEKPIYLQQCMDQAGVDLLNEYKKESADIINGTKK